MVAGRRGWLLKGRRQVQDQKLGKGVEISRNSLRIAQSLSIWHILLSRGQVPALGKDLSVVMKQKQRSDTSRFHLHTHIPLVKSDPVKAIDH